MQLREAEWERGWNKQRQTHICSPTHHGSHYGSVFLWVDATVNPLNAECFSTQLPYWFIKGLIDIEVDLRVRYIPNDFARYLLVNEWSMAAYLQDIKGFEEGRDRWAPAGIY